MFASCFSELISQATATFISCEPRLEHLFRRSFPDATILPGYSLEQLKGYVKSYDIDLCCPMGDIPVYTRQQLSDFKDPVPYLKPEPALVTKWRQRYAEIGSGIKIGVSWEGGKNAIQKRNRSIPLAQWIGLFDSAGVEFVNVQYGDCAEQLNALEVETGVEIYDWPDTNGLKETDDFAAKLAALDLVISIDNSTVHLAASMGIETWVMLPMVPDWRWLLDREDSPWYGSIKLFRQSLANDWDPVLQQVVEQLRGKTKAIPLNQSRPTALFINDTSNWYHWGCTATSSVIRRRLKQIGYELDAIPIKQIVNMQPHIEQFGDFESESFFEKFKQANHSLLDALSVHDLIIINGEGSIHGISTTSLNLLYIAHIAKQWFGKNVQIINHSCYPLELMEWQNSVEFNLYRQVYQQLDYVAIREPISHRLMDEGGISNSLSFDCMPLYIEQYEDQIEKKERSGVVLSGSVCWLKDSLDAIAKLVKYLQGKSIDVTVLIGARENMASDDVGFVNDLYAQLDGNIIVRVASTLQEWLETLANTKLLISGRFHHTIAAAMLDTPFVLLNSNTPKLDGVLELIGGPTPISFSDPELFDKLSLAIDEKLQGDVDAPLSKQKKQQLLDLAEVNFEAAERYFQELSQADYVDNEAGVNESVATELPQRSLENTEHGLLLFDHDESLITQSLLRYGEYAIDIRTLFAQMLEKGSAIVEFGSGIGVITVELARHVGEQGKVWAENREPNEFLLLCANLALNEIGNVEFFDSVSDVDLPECCDVVLLNGTPWTPELENIVRNRFASSRPFIMALGAIEGMEKLRQFPNYTFVEYEVDVARPDNFKDVAVASDNPPLLCLVGVPT
ncbi:MAG: polysaccharide pyruvyl transferase family protein [Pseudomonadales bacterium]|nr:polysaccharide pyruvyl transferase family protein [Pseudomonadales bacterium]